jgi:alpha-beta hydrolase superfamily lysophospholipase
MGTVIAAALGCTSCAVVDRMVADAILRPNRKGTDARTPDGMEARTFVMRDKVALKAWIARPRQEPRAVVFVLHGISDSKATQAGTLDFLAKRRIVGIAPDFRAHGQSGGRTATYGYLEKQDMTELRKAAEKEFPKLPIGLWGSSYGGAVALQAMGIDPEFDFAIIENTFADLRDVARQQVIKRTSLPVSELGPYFIDRAGEAGGFDPGEVSPENSMERIKVPVLHMHGEQDEVIPFEQGRRISRHAKTDKYRFVPIHKGTHYHLSAGDPATYSREVDAFLDRMTSGNK